MTAFNITAWLLMVWLIFYAKTNRRGPTRGRAIKRPGELYDLTKEGGHISAPMCIAIFE